MDAACGTRRAKTLLLLASTLAILTTAVVAPVLPALRDAFEHSRNVDLLVRLVLVMPALFIALGAPLAGLVADRLGRKPLLVASTALYAVAGLSGAVLDTLPSLLAGRAALGLAVAGTMTAATTFIADCTRGMSRQKFLGQQAAVIGLTGALFLGSGGLLADLHWRTPFLLYGAALLLVPPMARLLQEPARGPRAHQPDAQPSSLKPLLPLWGMIFLTQVLFYVSPLLLPFRLRELGPSGAFLGGLLLALLLASYAVGALFAARARQRLHGNRMFAVGFGATGVGYLAVMLQHTWPGLVPGLALVGFSLGLVIPNLIARVAEVTPARAHGRAMGGVTASLFLGQFVTPFLSGPLVSARGLAAAFGAAGVLALGFGLTLLLPRPAPRALRGA